MSLICVISGCRAEAFIESTCDRRIAFCQNHAESHSNECGKGFNLLKPIVKQQIKRNASADKKLMLLKLAAISQVEGIIKAVREALSSFLDSIDSEKKVVVRMGFGKNWNEKIIQSIETSGLSETSLLKFKKLLKDMQVIKNIILSDEEEKKPDNDEIKNGVMVPAEFEKLNIEDKINCLTKLDLGLPYYIDDIKEIKVSRDREIACICM